MIDKATVERIKDVADIVDVVGDYVHLVRRGANYMGLCPFHNERTPSFSVNRRKNFCFCFSCKQGGSPVNFIMKKEGLSYHDALLHLAKKYGIEVKEKELTDEERKRQSEREAMLIANEWAMNKMEHDLEHTDEGRDIGLAYLYHRGVTQEAIKAFHLGYSLDKGSELCKSAKNAGYDFDILKKLGLIGTSSSGHEYDRFRGRVIFPIMNSAGKVIAFGGRDLKGGPAKYINSPESDLYKKSNELYGIYQARASIIREDKCFLVEGYLDVIGMWQTGMKNVVASSGTALTDGQIALIHRFSENITLIYDGDAAGIKASLRGIDMLLSHKMKVKVLLLPNGHDPDSFARAHTPEEFQEYVKAHETDIIRFKAQVLLKDIKDDPQRRIEAIADMVTSLAHIQDPVSMDIYIQECSRIMNIPEETVLKAVVTKKNELSQKWKKERALKNIDRIPTGIVPGSNSVPPDSSKSTSDQDNPIASIVEKAAIVAPDENMRMRPLEKKLIEYCIKYGFIPFCHRNIEEDPEDMMDVLDFVREELAEDGLGFTVPLYQRLFNLLNGMREDYQRALQKKKEEIDRKIEEERKSGIEDIARSDLSIAMIERKEKELEVMINRNKEIYLMEFCRNYPAQQLASHEHDDIREVVNQLILEPYQLSNIYYRDNNVVELEQDRLEILIPRALNELKNEVINSQIAELFASLKDANSRGDAEAIKDIMIKINSKNKLRSEMAKTLGERVVSPATGRGGKTLGIHGV